MVLFLEHSSRSAFWGCCIFDDLFALCLFFHSYRVALDIQGGQDLSQGCWVILCYDINYNFKTTVLSVNQ